MDAIWEATLNGYVKLLYDNDPQGSLLKSIQDFEKKFCQVAQEHSGNPDIASVLSQTGLQDEYNRLYMASINRNNDYSSTSSTDEIQIFDYQKEQRLPTVHEFLNNYRLVYEQIRPNARTATNEAYEKLFDVENRTEDLFEAQMIIEREKLILNTVIADYKELAEDFLKASDPNFEITSSVVKLSALTYATATSLDEITYMGEIARGKADEIAVQNQIKMDIMMQLMTLIYTWEHAKRKVREGGPLIGAFAQSMVTTRERIRSYYHFLNQDMGLNFEKIEQSPFYRILLLDPKGLDELWRIKKVMHPDNIKATKYVLFEEILTEQSLEDILLSPQPLPYYEPLDSIHDVPGLDDEYLAIADGLNKDIPFFRRNKSNEDYRKSRQTLNDDFSTDQLLKNMRNLNREFLKGYNKGNLQLSPKNLKLRFNFITNTIKNPGLNVNKESIKEAIDDFTSSTKKEFGRGLLRAFLRK